MTEDKAMSSPAPSPLAVAETLMRMALVLLDREGQMLPAARLRHALDTLIKRPIGNPSEAWTALVDEG